MQVEPLTNRLSRIACGGDGELTRDARYDRGGNLIALDNLRAIRWDCRNHIAGVDVVVRDGEPSDSCFYQYDYHGHRIRKAHVRKISDGITEISEKIYIGDYEYKRIRRIADGTETAILERHTHRHRLGAGPFLIVHTWDRDDMRRESDTIGRPNYRYQLSNLVASCSMELDEAGRMISYEEYFPYGGTSFMAGDREAEVRLKEYRYMGKERDECTGLYDYGARYYAPWLGRWLSPDPALFVDGLNLFAFVRGNPINTIDRDGHCGDKQSKSGKPPKSPNYVQVAQTNLEKLLLPNPVLAGLKEIFTKRYEVVRNPTFDFKALQNLSKWGIYYAITPQDKIKLHAMEASKELVKSKLAFSFTLAYFKTLIQTGYRTAYTVRYAKSEDYDKLNATALQVKSDLQKKWAASFAGGLVVGQVIRRVTYVPYYGSVPRLGPMMGRAWFVLGVAAILKDMSDKGREMDRIMDREKPFGSTMVKHRDQELEAFNNSPRMVAIRDWLRRYAEFIDKQHGNKSD